VVLLLAMLWILNAFDLALTVICTSADSHLDRFAEANPVARYFLAQPGALFTFKLGALAFATTVLFILRRRGVSELGCWLLAAVRGVRGAGVSLDGRAPAVQEGRSAAAARAAGARVIYRPRRTQRAAGPG
jgi:hypothetical protein